ncbi:MAG: hypothetical protein CBARDMAM_4445 [uncultured Caballeronia sp.]|nr:MAG: hypothetical protein CBARDMAM_4445 [uncultured Caballeronia sp.]
MAENRSEIVSKELLTTLRDTAHTDSLAYQFEALKHLAITNSAGLAFCAAVMASNAAGAHGLAVAARLCAWGFLSQSCSSSGAGAGAHSKQGECLIFASRQRRGRLRAPK